MKPKAVALLSVGILFILTLATLAIIYFPRITQAGVGSGDEVVNVVPIMASLRCEPIDDKAVQYGIPSGGFWISKADIGAKTKIASDIRVSVDKSVWEYLVSNALGGSYRIRYLQCDANKGSCLERTQSMTTWGTYALQDLPSSIDLTTNSVYVVIQRRATLISSWQNYASNSRISYSYRPFGLVTYSPVGVGIATVCSTGCNINCPDVGVRQKIVMNATEEIGFYSAVNYISTWVEVSKIGEQLGGTSWIPAKQQFCFGGFVYDAGRITTQTGKTYIYPKTYVGQKACCPGAIISTQYADKICQSDFTWKTTQKGDVTKCSTDYQCANQGRAICQNKILSASTCSGTDAILGSVCQKSAGTSVQCCSNSDCARDMTCSSNKCVGGNVEPTIDPNKCIADLDCPFLQKCNQQTGKCEYRITIGGDEEQNATQDNSPACKSCWSWAGNVFKKYDNKCSNAPAWKSESWFGKLLGLQIKQDTWCPLLFVVILSVIALVAAVIWVIIRMANK